VPTETGCPEDGPGPSGLRATVRGNGSDRDAIRVKRSEDIVIRYLNIIKGKDDGVDFKRSNTSTLHCSCVTRNRDDGVELDGGDGHQVTQNLIVRNKDDGIIVERSRDNVLHANTIQENKDDGLEFDKDSDRNLVVSNLIENNDEDGIDVDNSDANRILANEVNGNGDRRSDNGIELRKSDDNVVDGNTIRGNGDNLVDVVRCQSGADDNRGSNVVPPCGTTTPEPSATFQLGLNGAEEVPPVTTSADGFCTGILDAAQTTFELVCTHGVSDTILAHIHRGVAGMDGPIVFDLGDPSSPIRAAWNLSATDVTALIGDALYVNVHSPAFPDGEVRGQIDSSATQLR
jgi:parallel beta-helix repeat protein